MTKYCLYHGTSKESSNAIIKAKYFAYDNKDIHYLGQGIYFYGSIDEATRWATVRFKNYDKTVLAVGLEVENADVLDLRRKEDIKSIESIFDNALFKSVKAVTLYDRNYERRKRCFLYDIISSETKCKLLIAPIQTDQMYMFLGLVGATEIQYCVKDNAIISNIRVEKQIPYMGGIIIWQLKN